MYIDHCTGGLLVCLPKDNAEGFCREMKVDVYTNMCNNDRVTQCIISLVIVTLMLIGLCISVSVVYTYNFMCT